MRSYEHFFFQSSNLLQSPIARRERRRSYDSQTSNKARRRSYDYYINSGVHVPSLLFLPSGEDTKEVAPSDADLEIIELEVDQILVEENVYSSSSSRCETRSEKFKESLCLEFKTPFSAKVFKTAKITKPNRRQSFVDL
jgi:hypothetical protein